MLTLEHISVKFDKSFVLQDVSFSVQPGEIVGLIGPNGSGKTTLLNTLSGFIPLDGGTVTYADEDISSASPSERARFGFGRSFQSAGVFREMTLVENLVVALEYAEKYPWWWKFSREKRTNVERKVVTILEKVGLLAHKHSLAGVLSGGQLRLLELMRLHVSKGKMLLIDEPTAGVSPLMKQVLAQTIRELAHEKNRSMILVEHDLKFLFDIVDRVIVLVEGKIYMQGTPKQILEDEKLKDVYFGR